MIRFLSFSSDHICAAFDNGDKMTRKRQVIVIIFILQ